MISSAFLQLSLVIDFTRPAPESEVKTTSLLTGKVTPISKASSVWESAPELQRSSFLSSCPDGDESSLSSVDDNTSASCLRPKLKGE